MDVDDFESSRDVNAPIDMLEHYFAARGWDFQRAGDEEIVAQFQGSWAQYELRAVWREEDRVLKLPHSMRTDRRDLRRLGDLVLGIGHATLKRVEPRH